MKKIHFSMLFILLLFSFAGCGGSGPQNSGSVVVTTIAGGGSDGRTYGSTDGTGTSALFFNLRGIAVTANGTIYVADTGNNKVRQIDPTTRRVTTIAGGGSDGYTYGDADGTGTAALFTFLVGIAVNPSTGEIFAVDGRVGKIKMITPATGKVLTIASTLYYPAGITIASDSSLCVTNGANEIRKITPPPYQVSIIASGLSQPSGLAFAKDGSIYLVEAGSHRISKITLSPYSSTIIAGGGTDGSTRGSTDGIGKNALFNDPHGIAIATDGSIYIADYGNSKIRKINPTTYQVTTVAGGGTNGITAGYTDGTGTTALFNGPFGIAVAPDGSLYVTDDQNYKIRKISF